MGLDSIRIIHCNVLLLMYISYIYHSSGAPFERIAYITALFGQSFISRPQKHIIILRTCSGKYIYIYLHLTCRTSFIVHAICYSYCFVVVVDDFYHSAPKHNVFERHDVNGVNDVNGGGVSSHL